MEMHLQKSNHLKLGKRYSKHEKYCPFNLGSIYIDVLHFHIKYLKHNCDKYLEEIQRQITDGPRAVVAAASSIGGGDGITANIAPEENWSGAINT